MRRLLLRGLLALLALPVSAALLELFVRVADPYGVSYYHDVNRYLNEAIELTSPDILNPDPAGQLFRNRGGVSLELRTFSFHTDALGLRAGEPGLGPPAADPSERLRVLCLGDSTTLAWGVDDEESWPRVLERTGRAADGRPLACMNAGHLMYDSVQEAALLQAAGELLQPELVLVMFNTNDLVPTLDVYEELVRAGLEQAAEDGLGQTLARARHGILRHFVGVRSLLRYRTESETLGRVERHDFTWDDVPGYPEGWPRARAALAAIRDRCAEPGAQLVVLDHSDPRVPELEPWCAAEGIAFVDVAWTDEEWKLDIRNSPADPHANAEGNRRIAGKVLAGLEARGILSR